MANPFQPLQNALYTLAEHGEVLPITG